MPSLAKLLDVSCAIATGSVQPVRCAEGMQASGRLNQAVYVAMEDVVLIQAIHSAHKLLLRALASRTGDFLQTVPK